MSQFYLGSEPLWAWVCSVFNCQDSIKELLNCVLDGLGAFLKKPRQGGRFRRPLMKWDQRLFNSLEMGEGGTSLSCVGSS